MVSSMMPNPQYPVPPWMFGAVQNTESGGDPNAISPAGAVGLMQPMPATLQNPGYGVQPAQNNSPQEQQRVGQDYLQAMFNHFHGDPQASLMAYNWGPGNVDKLQGGAPLQIPAETQAYVGKVMGQAPALPQGTQYAQNTGQMNDVSGLKEVTDPDLLKQLNAGAQQKEVTDPVLLAQLNGKQPEQSWHDRETSIFNKGMDQTGQSFNNLMADHVGDTDYSPLPDIMSMMGGVGNAFAAPVTAAFQPPVRTLASTFGNSETQKEMAAGNYQRPDKLTQDLVNAGSAVLPFFAKGEYPPVGTDDVGPPPYDGRGIFNQPPKPTELTTDMLNKAAPNAYNFVNNSNTGFTPALTDKVVGIINDAKLAPIAGKVLPSEDAAINNALGEYDDLKGSPLSLNDYQRIDSTLGNKAAQSYIAGDSNKARIIGDTQDKIRGLVSPENLDPTHITGSPEGINTLTQDAIPMWSTKRKIEDLQAIVDKANMTKNPQTAMMTGFKNYIKSGRSATLPPEVQKLVTQLATQGTGADLLSIVGSRLNPIVAGAAGGIPAAAVSYGTSFAARTLGNRIVNNRADAIVDSMLEQVRPSIERFANGVPAQPTYPPAPPSNLLSGPPTRLALSAPNTLTVNTAGEARPMAPEDYNRVDVASNDPATIAAMGARADQTPSDVLAARAKTTLTPQEWNERMWQMYRNR